jgi:histidinol dehydrogenase
MIIVDKLSISPKISSTLKSKASKKIKTIKDAGMNGVLQKTKGKGLEISFEIIETANFHLSAPVQASIESIVRIQEKVALRQYETIRPCTMEPTAGVKIKQIVKPVKSMAVVAPGIWDKEVPHELTSIIVAANVAGVSKRMVFLEPDAAGGISPLSLYAANLSEATHVWRTGGAHALVNLFSGNFDDIPERIFLIGGDRLDRVIFNILSKIEQNENIDLVLLIDSQSGIVPVIETIESFKNNNPLSNIQLVTTSKRILKKIEQYIEKISENKPLLLNDFKKLPVLIASSIEHALSEISKVNIDYLSLFISKPESIISDISSVNHILIGDIISPLVSKRGLGTGVIKNYDSGVVHEATGVYSFLKTFTVEKISAKAGERIRTCFKQIDNI